MTTQFIHSDGTPCDIPRADTLTADGRHACRMPEGRRLVLPQGTPVMCNGYPGAIVRLYDAEFGIYEVRVPGGLVASSDFTLITA